MGRIDQTGTSAALIPRVAVGWIHPFLEILGEVGAPWEQILKDAQLPATAIDDGSILVPTARIYDFVARASQETGIEELGLRAGARIDIEALLPDSETTWTRPGIFRSLEGFIQAALESSSNVDMWIQSRGDRERIIEFFYLGTFGPEHPGFVTVEQFMIALMVRWVRYGAHSRWNPARVNLRADTVPVAALRKLAGDAAIRCGQQGTSITFPSRQFSGRMQPFPDKDSPIWRRHRRSLGSGQEIEDLAGSLRLVLRAYLPDGSPTIDKAAKLAGTSVRTLQRRLREQNTSYAELIEGLRHDVALYLLRDPHRLAFEISQELGYRDPAIFTRAFRRWTGQTPSEFRRAVAP